jgi:Uroporphyrinogen-III decarboxylase
LMGMDKWMELFLSGPRDLCDELLRKCTLFVQQHIAALRAAGANVIVYSTPFGSPYFLSKDKIVKRVLPWMQQDIAGGDTDDLVYYCAMAPFNDVIELIFDQLGISTHYISPLADLAQAKEIIHTRGLTCGVIDDIKMIHWTPEQTRTEVQRIIETGKPGQHFLFGTGVLPLAVPEANIRSMLDAAFEFGRLP